MLNGPGSLAIDKVSGLDFALSSFGSGAVSIATAWAMAQGALDSYTINLNTMAKQGKTDPLIGRVVDSLGIPIDGGRKLVLLQRLHEFLVDEVTELSGAERVLLVLETGVVGVFVSLDLALFFFFWEVMLIPMYFLIGIWGHERRIYAAVKFFLYTMAGSAFLLGAILFLFFASAVLVATAGVWLLRRRRHRELSSRLRPP